MFPTYETLLYVYPVSWIITGVIMLVVYFVIRNRLFRERERGGICKPLEF